MGIRRRGFVMFPSLKENLGDHNFESHCEAETVVKRCLTAQETDLYRYEIEMLVP